MNIDEGYTLDDHEFRDDDMYALAKYRLTLRWLRSSAPNGRLLNVGCGGGVFNQMAHEAGYDVIGIEPDHAAFDIARRRAVDQYRVENVGLFDADSTMAADVVVMHDVLEHIDAEASAVSTLASLLVPGGVGVVSVPALEILFGYHDEQLGHFRRYTRTSLRRALSAHFDVIGTRYLGMSGVPLALWYSRLRHAPYPVAAASGGTSVMTKVVAAVCAVEERVPGPVGTSAIAFVRRR